MNRKHTIGGRRGRSRLTFARDPETGGGGGNGGANTGGDNAGGGGATEAKFTQADVDRIAGERAERERAKFADYDDLKAKAEAGKTTEQKLAELERGIAEERLSRLRLEVATSTEGLGKEWADDLKGANKDELEKHAKSLAERLGKAAGGTGRARTTRRTVTETATEPADKKAAAVQALRELRGAGA